MSLGHFSKILPISLLNLLRKCNTFYRFHLSFLFSSCCYCAGVCVCVIIPLITKCVCVCAGVPEGSYDPEWSVCDLERMDWSSASGWDGLSGIWWWESTGTDKPPCVAKLPQMCIKKWLTTAWLPVFLCVYTAGGCSSPSSLWGSPQKDSWFWGQGSLAPWGLGGESWSEWGCVYEYVKFRSVSACFFVVVVTELSRA